MFKFFTLAAAIAVMPLSQKNIPVNADLVCIAGSPFSFHFGTSRMPAFFEPEKKAPDTWDQNWMASVQEDIRKSEYNFSWEKKLNAYCTPNRKNNLRFFYTEDGFSAEPRTTKTPVGDFNARYMQIPGWKVTFKLDKKQIGSGKWQIIKNQANYLTSNITVQYINNDEGMRQNFIVHKPLSRSGNLKINFSVKTKLKSRLVENNLQFFHKSNNVLNYHDLKVWDANGRLLTASFKKRKKQNYCIQVNSEGAVYPITIDPVSTGIAGNPDWMGDDADQAGASFGTSVASAGDVNGDGYSDVIIGAPRFDEGASFDEGKAFVYHGSAAGLSITPNSTPDDVDQTDAFFGNSVASAGDVNGDGYSDVIIGAYLYDDGVLADEGRVFIYHGSATGLLATPSSMPDDCNQAGALFGASVASAGDVNGDGYSDIIIGAPYFQEGANTREGRAYVYYGSASGISASPDSVPDDANQIFAEFGNSVASAGDVNGDGYSDVVIGAPMWDEVPTFTNDGKCFVYHGSAAGLAASPNNTLDATNENNANLGISVACAGDVNGDGYSDIIAGAPYLDDGGSFDEGAAFIYFGSASGASATPNVTRRDANQAYAAFGTSVASAGDINGDGYSDVIIGAETFDDGNTDEGAAFIYFGNASGISASPVATLDDANQVSASFGASVAPAGDVNGDGYSDVIVGAYFYTDGVNAAEGVAFVYYGSALGINNSAAAMVQSDQGSAYMGFSVASAGDVNADGYSDVIVGAYSYDSGQINEGAAFIYHGSATGISTTAAAMVQSDIVNANLGYSVACAGDVNADGYGDVIAGAYSYTNGQAAEGAVFVYHGSASGINTAAAAIVESNQVAGRMGYSVAGAGDVNGDGYSDIITGAYQYDNGQTDEGAAFVYRGSASGVNTAPVALLECNVSGANFGSAVSGAGDVNGDGYSDVVVGAFSYSNGQSTEGAIFVYHGLAAGVNTTAAATIESNLANANLGVSVANAGDVNGDGYGDIIAGANFYTNGQGNEGAAFIYHGSASGINTTPATTIESNFIAAFLGASVAGAGDVNGDGYSDVALGGFGYDNGQTDEGYVLIYHGSPAGINATVAATLESNQAQAFLGQSVACAGDVNGDGYSDIIAGAYGYDNGQTDEGVAFVHHGNRLGSVKRNTLRLYNTDLITPLNSSNFIPGNFGAGLYSKSFLGRDKGKLVWETRISYNAYSGTPITNSTFYTAQQAAYTDLSLAGLELKNLVNKIWGGRYTKLRARTKYNPATAITGQIYGPWRYVSSIIDANNLGVLPIELISFNAAWLQKGKTARLDFKTDKETGTCCFDIEKSSDGVNFHSIGMLQAKNVSGVQSYSFFDGNANSKNLFYRIKIKGIAGQVDYSNIQQLQNEGSTEILVFPNPATDILQLQLNNNYGKMSARIINSNGQQVKYMQLTVTNSTIAIPVKNLVAGLYWLHLQNGPDKQVLQFIKQ